MYSNIYVHLEVYVQDMDSSIYGHRDVDDEDIDDLRHWVARTRPP